MTVSDAAEEKRDKRTIVPSGPRGEKRVCVCEAHQTATVYFEMKVCR